MSAERNKIAEVAALVASGLSYSKIAPRYGVTKDKLQKIMRRQRSSVPAAVNIPEEIVLKGDVVVCGDLHASAVDWALVKKACEVGQREKITKVAIVGDIMNYDVYSSYPHLWSADPFSAEIDTARAVFQTLLKTFKVIYACRGNHDARVIMHTQGQINMDMLGDMILPGKDRSRLKMSIHDRMWVDSPSGKWLLAHQKEFSRLRLKVAEDLAAKYGCHVITHHQHGMASGVSRCGRYVVVDNGCMCDPAMIAYKRLNTNAFPEWQQGFCWIKNGNLMSYVHRKPMGAK